jgi:hypothetical protein
MPSRRRWSIQLALERRQARRSALVVAPDRPTAVAHALRMKLDLSRIRIETELHSSMAQARLLRELEDVSSRTQAWHSAAR